MKETLKNMTESFTANNLTLNKKCGFQIMSRHTATACAFLFTANKIAADGERIKDCAGIVKTNAPKMSYFKLEPNSKFAASFLSLSSAPERLLEETVATYDKLKKIYGSSQYLAFAGLFLKSLEKNGEEFEKRLERGKIIYDCLKSRHKLLTDIRDSVFSLLLASSSMDIEDIIREVESTYQELKPLGGNGAMQACSLILTRSEKPKNEKIARFTALYEKLRENKPRYDNGWDMVLLAVLSLLTDDPEGAANDILDVYNELEDKNGYKGIFAGYGKYTRLLHAAMIVIADNLTEEMYDLAVATVFVNEMIKYDIESTADSVVVPV